MSLRFLIVEGNTLETRESYREGTGVTPRSERRCAMRR